MAHYNYGNEAVVPAEDKNPPPIQPVPTGHEPTTPELLNKLINELDEIRTARGQVLAETTGPGNYMGSKGYKSDVRRRWELDNKGRELSEKEDALMKQIRGLMHLLPPEQRPRTLGLGGF